MSEVSWDEMDRLQIQLKIVPLKIKIPYGKLSSFVIVWELFFFEEPYELAVQVRLCGEFEGVIPHAYPIFRFFMNKIFLTADEKMI